MPNMKKSYNGNTASLLLYNKQPRHENCPAGVKSWCEWCKAEARGEQKNYNHPPPVIKPDVEKYLIPIYEELSKEDLLTRCLGGYKQNSNESFNSMVWRLFPKH